MKKTRSCTMYGSSSYQQRYSMYGGGLIPIENFPQMQQRRQAKASDLHLFDLNTDEPNSSILFANYEVLILTDEGWRATYFQPEDTGFNLPQFYEIIRYVKVIAFLNPTANSSDLLHLLRDPFTRLDWQKLEQQKAITYHTNNTVTVRGY